MAWRIAARGNIDHNQLSDRGWMKQGEFHCGFATHRVTQHESLSDLLGLHETPNVVGHQAIVHLEAVRRTTVIALVQRENSEARGQSPAHRKPVLKRAKQPMQDEEQYAWAISLQDP